MSLFLAIVLVGVAVWAKGEFLGDEGVRTIAGVPMMPVDQITGAPLPPSVGTNSARSLWPPVPNDAQDRPLGLPPAQRSTSRAYAFMDTIDGSGVPVRFDPCRPIHVVVNSASAPAGADKLLRAGLAEISRTTGLRFVIDGATTERPAIQRPPTNAPLYGDRWSPVIVAWTDPATVPDLDGDVAAVAGPVVAPYTTDSEKHWVSGGVYLDGPAFAEILNRPGDGWWQAQAIVLHELAHLVGLTHIVDASQLMAPRGSRQLTFAAGDLEGLRQLGNGACFT